MKKPLVIANWKMYIATPEAAKKFAQGLARKKTALSGAEVWVAPPFTLIHGLKGKFKTGGQTLSAYEDGAHTGDISAAMLKSAGASFALIGHSERRASGESNEQVHEQLKRALEANLTAVLCVGERERTQDGAHFSTLEEQLAALRGMTPFAKKIIVAYEPVWAIGKSAADAMSPQELEEMAIFIRKTLVAVLGRTAALAIPILYGGSVEGENAAALKSAGVHGFLVGHASAELGSFINTLQALGSSSRKS